MANDFVGSELAVAEALLIWHNIGEGRLPEIMRYLGCNKSIMVSRSSLVESKCIHEHAMASS